MKKLSLRTINASEVSEFLNLKWFKDEFYIKYPVSHNNIVDNSLFYCLDNTCSSSVKNAICITNHHKPALQCIQLIVSNPELAFYRVLNEFFMDEDEVSICPSTKIIKGAQIAPGVSIADNCYIDSKVKIGSRCVIGRNVSIYGEVTLGNNVIIKDNCILGNSSYDFIEDEGVLFEKPCLGSIVIGNNTQIGSNTTIERPRFDLTIIEQNVKIDDLVNIGSNCVIRENSMISSGVVLCHQVEIGGKCFVAPNTTVKDCTKLGNNVKTGIGSVVLDTAPNNITIVGNPARSLRG